MMDNTKYLSVRKIGSEGMNTYEDPQDLKDRESPDILNMVFDRGYPTPRGGSTLVWEKPEGETEDPLCMFQARTSDGEDFAIACYAPNFYVRDEVTDDWIKINQTYTPSQTYKDLMYSYINWNAGRGDDRLYFNNGQESMMRWDMALSHVTADTLSTSTTLVVDDGARFPTAGFIVVKGTSGEFVLEYTSKTLHTLNINGIVGQDIPRGSPVTMEIDEKSSMAKGIAMARFQRRLFVANSVGAETTMKYSVTEDPEDFTTGSGTTAGGALIISDGNGEITGLTDFGEYLLIEKQDSAHRFSLTYNNSLDAKLDQITPIVSDKSMGPLHTWCIIKKNNAIYYPTPTEGIFALSPSTTGNQTSTGVDILSKPIQNFVKNLNFSKSRGVSLFQKLFWSCATDEAIDTILVYDVLRGIWARFNSWAVKDWLIYNNELYFISFVNGGVYKALDNSGSDNGQPFEVSIYSKSFDFGEDAKPKTMASIYVEGVIKSSTNLYCDVFYNESGSLNKASYLIKGNAKYVNQPNIQALAMVMLGLPIMGMGSTVDLDELGSFRVYLQVPIRYGFYVCSLRFYTDEEDTFWGVTGVAFGPRGEIKAPSDFQLGVIDDPANEIFDN